MFAYLVSSTQACSVATSVIPNHIHEQLLLVNQSESTVLADAECTLAKVAVHPLFAADQVFAVPFVVVALVYA